MSYLLKQPTTKKAPQSKPIPSREKDMARNYAGGFSFTIDSFKHMERFLVLGSEGGSYYCSEQDLTKANTDNVRACIVQDGIKAVNMIRDISVAGRAPKNDPALYALALAASYAGDEKTRAYALSCLPKVARTGTHLFQFCAFIDTMRGWGTGLRRAVAAWYEDKTPEQLAYQLCKYQQRNGWSHRDVLRLCHIKSNHVITRWALKADMCQRVVVKKGATKNDKSSFLYSPAYGDMPEIIEAMEAAKMADVNGLISLIRSCGLTREMIPTEHQKSPEVWEALLEKMPLTAMIRTLGRMGSVGLLAPLSDASKLVCERLGNADYLRKSRVHPIAVLTALLTYKNGRGTKGSLSWKPVPQIVDALDSAFYKAFEFVEPTGKNFYLGIDVSGSMEGGVVAGVTGLTPCMGAAAMAMVTVRTEPNYYVAGFSDGSRVKGAVRGTTMHTNSFWGSRFVPAMERLSISKSQRLDRVMHEMSQVPMGGTDCALPMMDALHNKIPVDCFIVYTDNETWAGSIHPSQALQKYRQKMGRDAKLIVCAMTSTGFTIADPKDPGQLDIVGFDASVPTIISQFVGGDTTSEQETGE